MTSHIYCYYNTKLQEMGDGSVWIVSLHYLPKLPRLFILPLSLWYPDYKNLSSKSQLKRYTITITIFKNPGFLAGQPVRDKSSLGSLSRWVLNINKDGDSSTFLGFCSCVEPGHFKKFFLLGIFFFLICSQNTLCSLLFSISTEESQLLPSTSKLLPKTENTNHFSWKALKVKQHAWLDCHCLSPVYSHQTGPVL